MTVQAEQIQFHPVAELFPLMEGAAFDELVSDIQANGLREPIWRFEGKIIDGRNRYNACLKAGVSPEYRDWDGEGDPVKFVMSLNLQRRHLTPSQRSMVAARGRTFYEEQAKERMSEGGKRHGQGVVNVPPLEKAKSRDLAGKAAGVSGTYVDRAAKVIEKGTPELIKSVDEGRMNVTTAAVLAAEPPDVQRAECAKPKRNRTYNSVSAPVGRNGNSGESHDNEDEEREEPKVRGVGIVRANEAINCLTRIPKNDALRKRGFQLVTDWIRSNK